MTGVEVRVVRVCWSVLVLLTAVAPWLGVEPAGWVDVALDEVADVVARRLLGVPRRVEDVCDVMAAAPFG